MKKESKTLEEELIAERDRRAIDMFFYAGRVLDLQSKRLLRESEINYRRNYD